MNHRTESDSTDARLRLARDYAMYTRRNIFLTGKAGTGKTTFLRHLYADTHKRAVILAPTGVAAINAGGVTIHSFLQIAPGLYLPDGSLRRETGAYRMSARKQKMIRALELIIIDEVSMVRCDLLDQVDDTLRRVRHDQRPFGGVQLLLIGDMQQLAPVTTDVEWHELRRYYPTPYFFSSTALRQTDYVTIELTKVYRQADATFVELLNHVRDNTLTPELLCRLNARYQPDFIMTDGDGYIMLTTHNHQSDLINRRQLNALSSKPVLFQACITGDFPETSFPVAQTLELKNGEQVMFCKNDPKGTQRYFNGKIGRVVDIDSSNRMVKVKCDDGVVSVEPVVWQNTRYVPDERTGEIREDIAGTFEQIPLRAAWAITIHKSQGLTFDRVVINAGSAFSFGQVYVALSRCRTLEGIILTTPIDPHTVLTDPEIMAYNNYMSQHLPTEAQLDADRKAYWLDAMSSVFDFTRLNMYVNQYLRLAQEHLSRLYPRYVTDVTDYAQRITTELTNVGIRFKQQLAQLIYQGGTQHNEPLQHRYSQAVGYFNPRLRQLVGAIIQRGIPDVDNKQTAQRLQTQMAMLADEYRLHRLMMSDMSDQFTLEQYWDIRARMLMNETDKPSADMQHKKTSVRKKKEPAATTDITNVKLYQALRQWRAERAAHDNVPLFAVLPNKVLMELCDTCPTDRSSLLAIGGFGPKKLSMYGDDVLRIIAEFQ